MPRHLFFHLVVVLQMPNLLPFLFSKVLLVDLPVLLNNICGCYLIDQTSGNFCVYVRLDVGL